MIYFFGVLGLIYLTFQIGKQDGKWGCFIALLVMFGIVALMTALGD